MKSLMRGLAGAAAGGALTFIILRVVRLPRFDLDLLWSFALGLSLILVFYAAVAIHEAGHLVAGILQGFRPCLFIVGPLKLERFGRRWRIGRNRAVPIFGGLASGIPDSTDRLRQRLFVLVAGGPAASALAGLAGVAVLVALRAPEGPRDTLDSTQSAAYLALLIFSFLSLAIAAASLTPGISHGYSSDGAQLLRFRRSSPEVEAEVAIIALSTASIAGLRPRDWDWALLQRALMLDPTTPRGAVARLFAHTHWLDRGDVERAREHLSEALSHRDHVARIGRPVLLIEAARFSAMHDGDPVAARRWLEEAGDGTLIGTHSRLVTEAAVLHAEGADGVDERLARAEAALPEALDRGGAAMIADQILALRRQRTSEPTPRAALLPSP